jgi:hypothetical protein
MCFPVLARHILLVPDRPHFLNFTPNPCMTEVECHRGRSVLKHRKSNPVFPKVELFLA